MQLAQLWYRVRQLLTFSPRPPTRAAHLALQAISTVARSPARSRTAANDNARYAPRSASTVAVAVRSRRRRGPYRDERRLRSSRPAGAGRARVTLAAPPSRALPTAQAEFRVLRPPSSSPAPSLCLSHSSSLRTRSRTPRREQLAQNHQTGLASSRLRTVPLSHFCGAHTAPTTCTVRSVLEATFPTAVRKFPSVRGRRVLLSSNLCSVARTFPTTLAPARLDPIYLDGSKHVQVHIGHIHSRSDTGRQLHHHHSTFTCNSPCLTTPQHHWTIIFGYPLSSTVDINIRPCLGDGLARASYHQHTTAWPRVMLVI